MKTPLSLDDARRVVADFVAHYNQVRLHSAIGYVAPADKLAGRETVIFAERDRKLNAERERRRAARHALLHRAFQTACRQLQQLRDSLDIPVGEYLSCSFIDVTMKSTATYSGTLVDDNSEPVAARTLELKLHQIGSSSTPAKSTALHKG